MKRAIFLLLFLNGCSCTTKVTPREVSKAEEFCADKKGWVGVRKYFLMPGDAEVYCHTGDSKYFLPADFESKK